MPTIPEQIAAAAVADTLKAARTEEEWPKLAWAASRGTFGSGGVGWKPPTFVNWPPTQSFGGAYFAAGGVLSGDAFVSLDIPNNYSLIGGEEGEYRSFSIWLFTNGAGTGNGYQLRLRQWSFSNSVPRLYKFVLSKFVKGEKTLIEESGEVTVETGGGFALAMLGGILTMWRRETAESEWVQVGKSNADTTFTEGYAGIDGNGSNPVLANLRWAALEPEAPPPPTISRVAVLREYPPDQVALRIDSPSGQSARWAEDEWRPENVLSDIEFSTEMPGGYKDLQGRLGRNPHVDWHDLEAFGNAYLYQPGVNKIWEGSLDKAPDVSGEQMSITPSFLGYQAALEDNKGIQVGIIDGDLNKWGDPSLARRQSLIKASGINLSPQISIGFQDAAAAAPGVQADFSGVDKIAGQLVGNEAWYYGGGVDIGQLRYDFVGDSTGGFINQGYISNDDLASSYDSGVNHNSVSASNQTITATTAGRKYALLQNIYGGGFIGQMTNIHSFRNIRVLGRHGLTPKGIWPNIGFSAKQIMSYVVPKYCQPLEIDDQYMDDDGYIIPQAWYGEPTTGADIIKDVAKYSLYDWFVYNGKRFEYRQPGTYGKFWRAYVGPSNLNELGLDSQRLWRSIIVRYQDVTGITRTVGPPGSGADVESNLLEITDPDHPAVRAGRTRRDVLDLGGIGTPATAIAVGQRFLEEANLINRSGSATLQGYVLDDRGVFWPVACVKAGDWISFVDAADTSYRKIVNTSYRHTDRGNEIDLDAPASGMEALLERLQAGLLSLGVG